MKSFKKKGSMILVYLIMGLVVILLMIPVIKYIKGTSDTTMMKDYGVDTSGDFVPYDYGTRMSAEDASVQYSIKALDCAISMTAGSPSTNCGKLTDGADTTNSSCEKGEYAFGTTCVKCSNSIIKLSSNDDSNIKSVINLVYRCVNDYNSGFLKQEIENKDFFLSTKNYFCSAIDVSELRPNTKLTVNDLSKVEPMSFVEMTGKDRHEYISSEHSLYCVLFSKRIMGNKVLIVPCQDISYSPSSGQCTIRAFELPQANNAQTNEGYLAWLKEQRAPRYMVFYEAFTPEEEMIWEENYGRVSTKAYVSAATIGVAFSLFSVGVSATKTVATSLRPKNIIKTFRAGDGSVTKRILTLPKELLASREQALAQKWVKEFLEDATKNGRVAAARKHYLRQQLEAPEMKDVKAVLGKTQGDLESAALSGNADDILYRLKQLENEVPDDKKILVQELSEEVSSISDNGIVRLYAFKKFVSAYSKDLSLLEKDLAASIKRIDGLSDIQKKEILDDIKKNSIPILQKKQYDKLGGYVSDYDDTLNQAILERFDNILFSKYYDVTKGSVSSTVTDPSTRSFLQSVYDSAKEKAVSIHGPNAAQSQALMFKYVGGQIIYLMEMQQSGIAGRYDSQGANTISLGQPYDYGPRPQPKISNSEIDDYILLLSRQRSISEVNTPRFYLASPCKTDLKVYATQCSCEVPRGAAIYYSQRQSQPFYIDYDSITPNVFASLQNSQRHTYWFDKLSPENKEKAVRACVYSSECFASALKNPLSIQALTELFYYGEFFKAIDWVGSKNQDTCYSNLQTSDAPLYDFWTNNFMEVKKLDPVPYTVTSFRENFVKMFPSRNDAKNSPLYQSMEQIAVKKESGKTCIISSSKQVSDEYVKDILFFYYAEWLQKKVMEDSNNDGSYFENLYTAGFPIFLKNSFRQVHDDSIRNGYYSELSPYFEKLAKQYYFNYYFITSDVADQKSMVKSCTNQKMSTKDASNELSDLGDNYINPSEGKINLKTQCMFIEPYNYASYTKKDYPYNYCFTGDLSDGWKVAKEVNNYGWTVGEVGATMLAGGFSGPGAVLFYSALSATTSVAQTGIDGWIISKNKWPQPKTSERQ